jgi:hypothetical protein
MHAGHVCYVAQQLVQKMYLYKDIITNHKCTHTKQECILEAFPRRYGIYQL